MASYYNSSQLNQYNRMIVCLFVLLVAVVFEKSSKKILCKLNERIYSWHETSIALLNRNCGIKKRYTSKNYLLFLFFFYSNWHTFHAVFLITNRCFTAVMKNNAIENLILRIPQQIQSSICKELTIHVLIIHSYY
jgi:hypothetical protein